MQNEVTDIKKLFQNGHLSDEGIAMWAGALLENKENELPTELKAHADQCLKCKKEILELYADLKITEKQGAISNTNPDKAKVATLNKRLLYRIAAIIIVLLSIGAILYFTSGNKTGNQQLFAEYFSPYPNIVTTKGLNEEMLSAGMYYYDRTRYDSALTFYNNILKDDPQNKEVLFFKGNCLLMMNQADEAIQCLNKVTADSNTAYRNPALWYLALSNLKAGNSRRAREILSIIAKEGTSYSKKARELLHRMR